MEFITVQPNQPASANTKQRINEHIARTSHRRLRKLRVEQYQDSRVGKPSKQATKYTIARAHSVAEDDTVFNLVPKPSTVLVPTVKDSVYLTNVLSTCAPRERFMMQYYATVVVPYLNEHCPIVNSMNQQHQYFRNNWIYVALKEEGYYRGFLLSACRHLSLVHQEHQYDDLAVEYNLHYISEQRRNVATGGTAAARKAITMALILGFDEIMLGDMTMAWKHINGATEIIRAGGGTNSLGLSDFIVYVLRHLLHGDRLSSWEPLMNCSSSFMKPRLAGHSITRA
ncbi:hypothetical protein IWW34DRAFT_856618 [Fusarium oxysporum f. sp. albedinis]|nr:hypothetical protein IWW34DRAFT_856618 [Fusarium oxysporum f. sp. albedinis]KAK2470196.1 hypothetical protein H9L39_18344 [Fusarium oxysporum f. sp. albedinis]